MDLQSSLLNEVATARSQFIRATSGLTYEQTQFKPAPDVWSVVDITEHMVWAEMGGINGIWRTVDSIRMGKPLWSGERVHHGLRIENIIDKTWKLKEQVPESAKPRWGGPLDYWVLALKNCQPMLEALFVQLKGFDLEQVIYPHILSGPLNVIQRMEFLRFHLNRHERQIENLRTHPEFTRVAVSGS